LLWLTDHVTEQSGRNTQWYNTHIQIVMLVLNAYVEIYFEKSLLYIIVGIRLILYIWHVILIQLYITDVVLHIYVVVCNWGYGV